MLKYVFINALSFYSFFLLRTVDCSFNIHILDFYEASGSIRKIFLQLSSNFTFYFIFIAVGSFFLCLSSEVLQYNDGEFVLFVKVLMFLHFVFFFFVILLYVFFFPPKFIKLEMMIRKPFYQFSIFRVSNLIQCK